MDAYTILIGTLGLDKPNGKAKDKRVITEIRGSRSEFESAGLTKCQRELKIKREEKPDLISRLNSQTRQSYFLSLSNSPNKKINRSNFPFDVSRILVFSGKHQCLRLLLKNLNLVHELFTAAKKNLSAFYARSNFFSAALSVLYLILFNL